MSLKTSVLILIGIFSLIFTLGSSQNFQSEAQMAAKNGEDSLAIALYLQAFAQEKDDPSVLLKIAQIQSRNRAFQAQATTLAQYLEASQSNRLKDHFALGIAHYNTRNFPKANAVFENIMAKWPESHLAFLMSGRCYANIDQDSAAFARYSTVSEMLETAESNRNSKKDLTEAYRFLIAYCYLKGDADQVDGLQKRLDALKED